MAIRLIADSTCDITIKDCERMGVELIPLKVTIDGKTYLDKFELTNEEFYEKMAKAEDIPVTTLASPHDFMDKFDEYKATIDADNSSATAFYTENGAIFGNQNIGVIYRKSAKDSVPFLRDDEIRAYLSMLTDENVCKILACMAENAKSFTAASIAAKCGMTANEATIALEILKKHVLVASRTVDLGDETVTVWEKYAFHKILFIYSIMALAKKAASREDHYYCFHGDYTWC